MKNWRFHRSLRARGLNTQKLAALIGNRRHSHVSQVLNNVPKRGKETRLKLIPLLTAEEIQLLGWQVKQSSTENIVPAEDRPNT